MQHHDDLRVWQKARELVKLIYQATENFPERERFGLTNQVRRAAVSIAANIAEGSKRKSAADFARFLNIAEGSGAELDCLLTLSSDLGFLDEAAAKNCSSIIVEIQRMLYALRTKIVAEGR
jgi:four helix bundle protein